MAGFSPRLAALNLFLRLAVRPRLAVAQDLPAMRRSFEREAQFFLDPPGADYQEQTLQTGDGPLRLIRATAGEASGPALLYLHGGGFVTGSSRTHRHLAAWLAGGIGGEAFVPDYRLAPEHPFPAALRDAVAVYRHMLQRGAPPGAIGLAGDSAGGGLVFSLLLRLAELGLPAPGAVVTFSPWADLTGGSESLRRNARNDVLLPPQRFADTVSFYLGGQPADDPLASPVLGRFRAPPPALIFASTCELLTDDAVAIASALRRGGGRAELHLWPDLPHAWPIFAGRLPDADRAVDMASAFLRRRLGKGGDSPAGGISP